MKRSIVYLLCSLMLLFSFAGCGNEKASNDGSDASVKSDTNGSGALSSEAEFDKKYWTENALEEDDITTYVSINAFLEDFSECVSANTAKDVPASAFSLFGYFEARFEKGTVARYVSALGWEAIDALYKNNKNKYLSKMYSIEQTLNETTKKDDGKKDSTQSSSQENQQLVCDDTYATIYFIGCEKNDSTYGEKYKVSFIIENKTNQQLIARVDSIAVDGWTLSDAFIYEEIAQHSKAKVIIKTDELKSLDVKHISGILTLSDKSYSLWGELVRDYSFDTDIN